MSARFCWGKFRFVLILGKGGKRMDMGIKGRKAIVCAASKGLGKGCAMALAQEGVDLVINARTKSELEATAEEIRKKTGVKVTAVAVDVTTDAGRKQVLAACPEPDIIVNNAGGPPPGRLPRLEPRRLDQGDRRQHADADRVHQGDGRRHDEARLRAHREHHLELGEGADRHPGPQQRRAERPHRLRGRRGAHDTIRHGVTINGLLPGPFDTDRLRGTYKARAPPRAARATRRSTRPAPRPTRPAASARRRNSARCARSCAACMRAT